MNAFWSYFWPAFAAGLLCGALAGIFGFRPQRRRAIWIAGGAAVSILLAALWHGPFGAADRLSSRVGRDIHQLLVDYEMTKVHADLHRGPLTRRALLSGPADDFQRSELARLIQEIPGVREARWAADGGGIPLIAEGIAAALLGFLFGLLLAYLVELRRRYNAEWNW